MKTAYALSCSTDGLIGLYTNKKALYNAINRYMDGLQEISYQRLCKDAKLSSSNNRYYCGTFYEKEIDGWQDTTKYCWVGEMPLRST